ncbi:MAG TPA: HlyD family efflux transporter periplasmic adaptor subunit, partial [Clostridia bacterium]|nr:HlyD family efflux transporter periplasmic adaptor subunit [Clostridia bacterium]
VIFPILILLTAAAVYAGAAYIKASNADSESNYIYYGTAEAEQIDISPEVSGRLKEIRVEEGQSVKAGELLAVIDTPESRIKAEQSELSLGSAENELLRTEEGNREEEINIQRALVRQGEAALKQAEAVLEQTKAAVAQSEENLKSAQETYTLKKQDYDDIKVLFDNGAAALQDLDNAEHTMNTALHALENSSHSLESARAQLSGSAAQADGAKSQLEAAEEKLELLIAGATERSIAASRYGVEQAEKGLELSRLTLDKSNVPAAKDGTVETINFSEGEYVGMGSPIITLIDPSELRVKVYVPEKTLPELKTGKQVSIKCDYLKDKTIKGEITYISPEAEFTPLNIVTKEDRMKLVYAVKVKILDNLESIKPGMLLDVNVK